MFPVWKYFVIVSLMEVWISIQITRTVIELLYVIELVYRASSVFTIRWHAGILLKIFQLQHETPCFSPGQRAVVEFPHVFEETTLYVNSDTVIAVMLCITALAMMLAFHIILSVVLGGGTNGLLTAEPVCSRFGYEEKILAKTIRLDVSVQDLIKSVTNVQTASEALNIKLKEFEARLDVLESMKHDTKETVGK